MSAPNVFVLYETESESLVLLILTLLYKVDFFIAPVTGGELFQLGNDLFS